MAVIGYGLTASSKSIVMPIKNNEKTKSHLDHIPTVVPSRLASSASVDCLSPQPTGHPYFSAGHLSSSERLVMSRWWCQQWFFTWAIGDESLSPTVLIEPAVISHHQQFCKSVGDKALVISASVVVEHGRICGGTQLEISCLMISNSLHNQHSISSYPISLIKKMISI
jgi:hypothetical protein